jgi:ribosomal-protein-alanine N-acetyltransferase
MLKGKKIELKLVVPEHLDSLFNHLSQLEIRGNYFPHTLSSFSQFKKSYEETGFWSNDFGRFLIMAPDTQMVGSIYYFKTAIYSDCLELGFLLFNPLDAGKGYMSEAIKLMVNYLFSSKTMNRLQVNIAREHIASIKAVVKVGFEFEATRKQVLYIHGKHHDLDEYVLLRENWEKCYHQSFKIAPF